MNSLFINLSDPVIFQSFGGEESWSKVEFPAGSVALKEGDESQDFYYIFSGLVKVTKSIKDGEQTQKLLATLGVGDFFGEGALLSDKTRGATVTALQPTILLKLSQAKFEALVTKDPQAAVGIILGIVRVLNVRLQGMNERLVALERVLHLIREYSGNTAELIPLIFKELAPVTHHGFLGLLSLDGQLKWATASVTSEQMKAWSQALPVLMTEFAAPSSPGSFISSASPSVKKDSELYLAVRNLKGELRSVLCATICSECEERDLHLLLTVAEQIGNLL